MAEESNLPIQNSETISDSQQLLLDSIDQHYLMIDVGANLTNKKYQRDLDTVVQRAQEAGVQKIVVTGTSLQASRDALRLTRLYPGILYCTVGK